MTVESEAPEAVDEDDPFEAYWREVGGEDPTSPYPTLADLRERAPVHPGIPELGMVDQPVDQPPQFTAYSYDAVVGVLSDNQTFSSSVYADVIGVMTGRSLLEMDEPEHRTYRRILQKAFSRAAMNRWEDEIVRPLVEERIDAFANDGRAELVQQLCLAFPLEVITALLGLPAEDHDTFHRLAIEMINVTANWDRAQAASNKLRDYFAEILAQRRVDPREDMISVLAEAELDGQRLTDDDIFAFLRLLLPAGAETTFRSSSSLLLGLLTNPDQLDAVRADPELIPRAIDEGVRWETPLLYIPRVAVRDVDLGGVAIPAGAGVTCNLGAANRDPSRFENPDQFDVFRDRLPSVGFGHGVHACLGIHLARMETGVVIETLLDRIKGLRLDPTEPEPLAVGIIMRSPRRLNVVW